MLEVLDRLLPAANVSTLLEILDYVLQEAAQHYEYAWFQPFLRF